jgi:hypothetical protein
MHPTYRGLAFLLSLGTLPIACNKDDKETEGTGGGTTTPGTDPTTSSTTGTGTDPTDPTTPTTTAPDATTTTGGTEGMDTSATEPAVTTFLTSNTDTGETGFDTDEPPPLPRPTDPTCLAYAAHIVECFPMYAQYRTYLAQYCEYYKMSGLRADGQACQDAFEAFYVCLTNTECADFMEGPCATENDAIGTACPSLGGESESGDTMGDTANDTGSGDGGSTG